MKRKLLVVDDQQNLLNMLQNYCESKGYIVVPALNYMFDPLPLFEKKDFYAAIMDYDIEKGYNGGEFVEKYDQVLPVFKRILMSGGSGWSEEGTRGIPLHKPFRLKELSKALDMVQHYEREYMRGYDALRTR